MSDIVAKLRERPWRRGGETDVQAKERRQKEREEGAAEIERLTARVEELERALEEITNLPGELNPSNYDHDDACACNAALCEAYGIARAAITKGESNG